MTKNIKLVVTDIDGTIIKINGNLESKTKETFNALQKKGIKIVIATGRMYKAAQKIIEELNLDTPIICYQGAMIRDTKNIYFEKNIKKEIASNIIDDLRNYQVHINLYLKDRLIVENDNEYIKEYAGDRIIEYEVVADLKTVLDDATKLLAIDKNADKITKIRDEMRIKYPQLNIVKSTNYYCEFVNNKADKGIAIKFLAKKWNIKKEEILAIGDQDNDIEMIKTAGIGIAMGNGSTNIKKAADFICQNVEDFGFSKAMEKFVL